LYAQGDDVDPLIAIERPQRVLSSGDKALIVIDGRHRTFAAADAGVDSLPVFVATRTDAVFSY
jgi:ParB-like chromosome segregation protein Spo0J